MVVSLHILKISITDKTPDRKNIDKNRSDANIVNKKFIFNGKSITSEETIQRFRNANDFFINCIRIWANAHKRGFKYFPARKQVSIKLE